MNKKLILTWNYTSIWKAVFSSWLLNYDGFFVFLYFCAVLRIFVLFYVFLCYFTYFHAVLRTFVPFFTRCTVFLHVFRWTNNELLQFVHPIMIKTAVPNQAKIFNQTVEWNSFQNIRLFHCQILYQTVSIRWQLPNYKNSVILSLNYGHYHYFCINSLCRP